MAATATTLAEVIAALGGDLLGDPSTQILALQPLAEAGEHSLAFLANPRYQSQLLESRAACVIVAPALAEAAAARGAAIVTADPYLYFARLTQWWARRVRPQAAATIHASAVIAPTAQIGAGVSIGALAVVEDGAVIGDGASIGPHCVIEAHARIGAGTRLAARVTLGFDCSIGERGIVHGGVVIGADGFGFAPSQGQWVKIEQLGAVRIGDDVEIGANTCIDRGALGDTVIENGVKLDNLIQIAHNVHIGEHTAMAGCVGVAGSAVIGKHCTVGGAAIILGHLSLVDGVHVSAGTAITRSVNKPGVYSGMFPFDENASWEKNAATLRQLHALRERVRALEKNSK
ncbi:UDP-3-O-(3-hydroxymyristoyl)glucosamine N-acyltransferase [Pelomonas sp. SE-A7]|uniref:UDP-3-O-(3-hydroxymyristoyl)glucosamine N-acyltransferase n=1 Tax=Pelomonas sp. SE-A7 TaxID=3054953 RepID=UPI00259CEB5D|nr:UDP-3-O-(3-hydroxymyristoyl)glucosamine N-acyltransferase [Pelomonas sp. SE-A7]MDM4767363.1 UDP-3-O-(3-hydroxymyristoyl)glucosamine N-acyltransferase [Pelomonas sp. SE-A7]